MISVCLASYNGEKYIHEQLSSILACLDSEDELIVSDDGSSDGTISIIKDLVLRDKRIKLVDGPHRGVIANFSNLISLAKGDEIFLSDQDDVWHPDKVSKVMSTFEMTGTDLVTHNARIVDSERNPTKSTLFSIRSSKPGFLKNVVKNSYVGCCMAFKREIVPYILPIPENIEMHDWWIGLVGELMTSPVFIDDELIDYRRHNANVSPMNHYGFKKMVNNRVVLLTEIAKRRQFIAERGV